MAATFATQTTESYSNSQQTSTPVPIKIPHASNLNFTGQWQGPESRTQGHGNNELEGTQTEFSAQIVHAVNQHSHPLTLIKI